MAAEMKAAGGGPDKGTYTLLLEACLRCAGGLAQIIP